MITESTASPHPFTSRIRRAIIHHLRLKFTLACFVISTSSPSHAEILGASGSLIVSPLSSWARANQTLGISIGVAQQHYEEHDPSSPAPDGVLDREEGRVPTGLLKARWQGSLGPLPVWAEMRAGRAAGQTHYHGFLQQYGALIPYENAKTGNVIVNADIAFGVPVTLDYQWQVVPYIRYGSSRWQRDLFQYREIYHYRTSAFGALLQYRPTSRLLIEGSVAGGRTSAVELAAPELGFSGKLGGASLSNGALSIQYTLVECATVGLEYTSNRYRFNASEVLGGLQEPQSQTRLHTVAFLLSYKY